MRLFAFQGLRYARSASEAGALAAPPYDQIPVEAAADWHALSPYHFTHLTRPVAADEDDAYRRAARLHADWLDAGVLTRDEAPRLYLYRIRLAAGGERLGVMGLVGQEPDDNGVIRPHEQTLAKPLADRLALLEAMRVDLEPILLLVDDGGRLDQMVRDDLAGAAVLVRHTDEAGHVHELAAVEDPARIAAYRDLVAAPTSAIADGHHRYKVSQRFAANHPDAPPAARTKLSVVTSLAAAGLTIDPIHRALLDPAGLDAARDLAIEILPGSARDGATFAQKVAEAPQPAIGVWCAHREPEIWRFAAGGGPRQLAVGILQLDVIAAMGHGPESASDGTVLYRSNPDALAALLREGKAGVGFFLPPMSPAEFGEAISKGEMLPPKSTRFLPKVVSGLVWAAHDSELG